ncbi:MAG: hypothetical protein NT069_35640 [Planctomycetota bacterium]|nr:hypothetical protein [Planctomycetota bacterium]
MNNDAALVDEIVRRILQQLPGVVPTPRTEPVARPEPQPVEAAVATETNGGRLLTPPSRFEATSAAPALIDVAVSTNTSPATSKPSPPRTVLPGSMAAVPAPASLSTSGSAPPATAVAGEVTIAERIITAEVLEKQLHGARIVRVSAKALLTPSAHDVVRSRRLEVVRESADPKTKSVPRGRWILVAAQPTPGLAGAIATWRGSGALVDQRLAGDPADAAAQAISAICRGEADNVFILSAAPEWVACLANRNEKVRAAAIADAGAILRLNESFRPNVLAFDGSKRGSFELTGLFKALDR